MLVIGQEISWVVMAALVLAGEQVADTSRLILAHDNVAMIMDASVSHSMQQHSDLDYVSTMRTARLKLSFSMFDNLYCCSLAS